MNAQPEDFEQLRKLLALKRHEVPPPRYFNEFSGKVIARLQQPEPEVALRWWQMLGLDLNLKPAFLCATGVAVCALLSVGIISATQVNPALPDDPFARASLPQPAPGPIGNLSLVSPSSTGSSTTPLMDNGSPFSRIPTIKAQNAGYHFGSQ